MIGKEYKWIVPEFPSRIGRKCARYENALEFLKSVKVCSRRVLNERFSSHVIQRLLKNEDIGFINLRRQSQRYRVCDLFDVSVKPQSELFIVYLKGEKEALAEYLAKLVKKPLDRKKARALSWRLKSLDEETRLKIIRLAGFYDLRRYDACVEEFWNSGLKSARVNFPNLKPNGLSSTLAKSINNMGLRGKVAVRKRGEKVFLVRLE